MNTEEQISKGIIFTPSGKMYATVESSTAYPLGTLQIRTIGETWEYSDAEERDVKTADAPPFVINGKNVEVTATVSPDNTFAHFYAAASDKTPVPVQAVEGMVLEVARTVRDSSYYAQRIIVQKHFYAYKAYRDAMRKVEEALKSKDEALSALVKVREQAMSSGLYPNIAWEEKEQDRVDAYYASKR